MWWGVVGCVSGSRSCASHRPPQAPPFAQRYAAASLEHRLCDMAPSCLPWRIAHAHFLSSHTPRASRSPADTTDFRYAQRRGCRCDARRRSRLRSSHASSPPRWPSVSAHARLVQQSVAHASYAPPHDAPLNTHHTSPAHAPFVALTYVRRRYLDEG